MSVIIQAEFGSAVTEANRDVYIDSYIEDGGTVIEFGMRKRDYNKEFGTGSEIFRCRETYTADIHEFSAFRRPVIYRFVTARGYCSDDPGNRIFFTPEPAEVSAQRHMSGSVIRTACFPAAICGISLRNTAAVFTYISGIPVTKPAIKRRIDGIGGNPPPESEILKKLTEPKKTSQCRIDAYYPLGTDRCVTVIKDGYDRILIIPILYCTYILSASKM